MHPEEKAGLIVVDVQNDFCPGGSLGVTDGDQVIPVLNTWIRRFVDLGLPIAYTLDWHPKDHCSFQELGGTWPAHCVQETNGSSLRSDLELPSTKRNNGDDAPVPWAVFKKGFLASCEAYSGFDGRKDGAEDGVTLGQWLKEQGVDRVYVGGLATEYCVKATVQDGLKQGFKVSLITEAVRSVDVNPGDGDKAIGEMLAAGAELAR